MILALDDAGKGYVTPAFGRNGPALAAVVPGAVGLVESGPWLVEGPLGPLSEIYLKEKKLKIRVGLKGENRNSSKEF